MSRKTRRLRKQASYRSYLRSKNKRLLVPAEFVDLEPLSSNEITNQKVELEVHALIQKVIHAGKGSSALEVLDIDHPIWEFVAPLIIESEVKGSCFFIAEGTAITAGHVFNLLNENRRSLRPGELEYEKNHHSVNAVRVDGARTDTQRMLAGVNSPATDIAFLSLKSTVGKTGPISKLPLTVTPPPIGSKVVAFGRPDNIEGTHLNSNCYQVVCEVVEIHSQGRDQRLPFACFRVDHDFPAGMSGGPVFDDNGFVCGVVCSGGVEAYVALLWPSLATKIAHDTNGVVLGQERPLIDFLDELDVQIRDIEKFSVTEDGRPQYHHGLGTLANPYQVNTQVDSPEGVEDLVIRFIYDKGMSLEFLPEPGECSEFSVLAERCIRLLLDNEEDELRWTLDQNVVSVSWTEGILLHGRLAEILRRIEAQRLSEATRQQSSFVERWELDKLLGR